MMSLRSGSEGSCIIKKSVNLVLELKYVCDGLCHVGWISLVAIIICFLIDGSQINLF